MIEDPLKRYTIDISNIDKLNIKIEAYQRMIDWYESYLERKGEYEYVQERIDHLNNEMSEYLIAREFAKEGCRTYG